MKKKKQKAIVKEQKRTAKKELKAQFIAALSTVIPGFESDKKVQKIVAKSAKQLAEKVAVFTPAVLVEVAVVSDTAPESEAVVPVKEKKAGSANKKKAQTPA